MAESDWYLLIHQLPTKPLYLRAKVRRALDKAGALGLKNSVYVLPRRDACRDALLALVEDAKASGGEAFLCEARFVGSGIAEALVDQLRRARARDYQALAADVRALAAGRRVRVDRAQLTRARRRLSDTVRIDFFDAPGRAEAESALKQAERRLAPTGSGPGEASRELRGRTWVTRRGVQIDRIASAWFVRRFVDPKARFRFFDPGRDALGPREIGFDFVGADYTHEADRCTLETLVARTGVRDAALARVAEIVHDIDIKDGKFGRTEAQGIARVIQGLVATTPTDEARLERGFAVFDDLYQSFRRGARKPLRRRRRSPSPARTWPSCSRSRTASRRSSRRSASTAKGARCRRACSASTLPRAASTSKPLGCRCRARTSRRR